MTEPAPLTVAIVDDHSIFRAGVRAGLPPGLQVVGEAATVDEAVTLVAATRPRVVLLDVHLPGGARRRRCRGHHAVRTGAPRTPGSSR